jgi:hypothetical protein
MEQVRCNSQFKPSDVDGELTPHEGDCVKPVAPDSTKQMLPAEAFVIGTWERRMLIDVLARMSRVVLESQRDPGTGPVEALLNTRGDGATPVSPPIEGFHSS